MGMFEWVDPTREAFQKYLRGRTDFLASLPGQLASFNLGEAMARQPKPFDRSQTGQQMLDAALNAGPSGLLGKIVYHGSPHKFDKFDASKIGTGEGAQAYGHGIYVAENPAVAAGYYKNLGGDVQPLVNLKIGSRTVGQHNGWDYSPRGKSTLENIRSGLIEDALINEQALIGAEATGASGVRDYVLGILEKRIKDYATEWPEGVQPAKDLYRMLSAPGAVKAKIGPTSGAVYKADLPDEWIPKMLDWDKPISHQPKEVVDGFRQMLKDQKYLGPNDNGPRQLNAALKAWKMERAGMADKDSGNLFWQAVNDSVGSPDKAAEYFRNAGVPGIRYLDGGSRSAGQGSYNYVVFPGLEDQVKILERNGIPLEGMFKMGK